MEPIFTDVTTNSQNTVEEDLEKRRVWIQAGEELKRSPALQQVIKTMYHGQAHALLNLGVSQTDSDNGFKFILAHNNVAARLDILKAVWNLGYDIDSMVAEYQNLTKPTNQE